jgi:hypothetical protein
MTECEAIEQNEPKIPHKTNNSTLSGKTVTHKKSHATQKNEKVLLYRTRTNPTHHTDRCYTL